jgi:hypothetical protein
MQIIGHLVKNATRIGHELKEKKRSQKPSPTVRQAMTLERLLRVAKHTDFGILHRFDECLRDPHMIQRFQQAVPISNYKMYHQHWLKETLKGKPDVIWPGKIRYYAKSSGTSEAASKFIPVSSEMLRQFRRTTLEQISNLYTLELSQDFYGAKVLVLGGSTNLEEVSPGVQAGDLSGILVKNKSTALSSFTKPGTKTAKIQDWNDKIDRIVRKAEKWDIGVISGVPSWTTLLLERIVSYYRVETIHDIWPNLRVYVHGGVFLDPYKVKLEKLFGREMHYQNTFLASEGYFAYQRNCTESSMELLADAGIFYEFVEEEYFPRMRTGDFYDIPTRTLDEVEVGKGYAMVISTCSGLWRYSLEDIVEFTDVENYTLRITGRLSHTLNMSGEHLSEANMTEAIQETARVFGISVEEFCVHPSRDFDRHNWYIGTNQHVNVNQFTAVLNHRLEKRNDDYANARRYILKAPKVKVLPVEKFYEFMLIRNSYGAQHKFPRVLSPELVKEWEIYLTNIDELIERYTDKSA